MIYHRKAETVRAIQLIDDTPEVIESIEKFTSCDVVLNRRINYMIVPYCLNVFTDHGVVIVRPQEWLVISPQGWKTYSDDAFKQRYEEGK
ncbi:hypothetical protein D1872_217820 [compost metagenome]